MEVIDYPTFLTKPQAPNTRRVLEAFGPDFVEMLRKCGTYTGYDSIYLCSLVIDPIDKQGGAQIAWLRKQAWKPGSIPTAEEERGAMGEWMILRRASRFKFVEAVSLVSIRPVCEPDLTILADAIGGHSQVNIDIKTTAAKSPPSAHYNLIGNESKGMPHFLVVILATKKSPDRYADLYFVNSRQAFTPQQVLDFYAEKGRPIPTITSDRSESFGLKDAFRIVR